MGVFLAGLFLGRNQSNSAVRGIDIFWYFQAVALMDNALVAILCVAFWGDVK